MFVIIYLSSFDQLINGLSEDGYDEEGRGMLSLEQKYEDYT